MLQRDDDSKKSHLALADRSGFGGTFCLPRRHMGRGEAARSIDQSYEAPVVRLANSNSVDGSNASGPAMVHVAHHARVIECLSSSNSAPREAIIFRAPTVTTGSSTAMAATIISRAPAATFSRAARAPTISTAVASRVAVIPPITVPPTPA